MSHEPPPPESPLDPRAIETLRSLSPDGDGSFLTEIVTIFLEEGPRLLAEIDDALEKKDGPRLARAAHSLKGSSSNFGAVNLRRLAESIENNAGQSAFAPAAGAVEPLRTEYERVAAALRDLLPPDKA